MTLVWSSKPQRPISTVRSEGRRVAELNITVIDFIFQDQVLRYKIKREKNRKPQSYLEFYQTPPVEGGNILCFN